MNTIEWACDDMDKLIFKMSSKLNVRAIRNYLELSPMEWYILKSTNSQYCEWIESHFIIK